MTIIKKQQYHLEAPAGLLNDPNGLSWYHGKYHVFFQWNRKSKDHSYKEWGLFTSKDLVRWQFEGSAIVPGERYDRDGVYSGSGLVIDSALYLYYTGNRREGKNRISSQCLAVTEDGRHCRKKGVVLHTPEEYTGHFRDPKVFRGQGTDYFMVIGGQRRNGKGAVALCRSADGREWTYQGVLAASDQYEMIECPDLFRLDGRWVLLYNPQKRDNASDEAKGSFSAYKLETFDEGTGTVQDKDLDSRYEKMDAGFDFYAPQTMETPDGRRILFAWMSRMDHAQEQGFGKKQPNLHCLTIPRELLLRGRKLCQRPAKELYEMLGQESAVKREGNEILIKPASRAFCLKMQTEDAGDSLQINFHGEEAVIRYSRTEGKLTFSRKNWLDGSKEKRSVYLDRLEQIEIWSDRSSMELFVNRGETVLSARICPEPVPTNLRIKGEVKIASVQVREIMDINSGN